MLHKAIPYGGDRGGGIGCADGNERRADPTSRLERLQNALHSECFLLPIS